MSTDAARAALAAAEAEPKDPATDRVMDAVLELIECVERGQQSCDARAQLWARVYAAEFDCWRRQNADGRDFAHRYARDAADAAVRDFDEHYCGGKR